MTTLLRDEAADALVAAVANGVPFETAATAAGLHHGTIQEWLHAASGTWRNGSSVSQSMQRWATAFSERIAQARAEWEAKQVAAIMAAAEQVNAKTGQHDWRVRTWLLNNHPATRERWHELHQVDQQQSGTITHEHRLAAEIAQAGGLPALEAKRAELLEQYPDLDPEL